MVKKFAVLDGFYIKLLSAKNDYALIWKAWNSMFYPALDLEKIINEVYLRWNFSSQNVKRKADAWHL